MEKTKKGEKSNVRREKKLNLNIFFLVNVNPSPIHHICRKEEGDVDASLHNIREHGDIDKKYDFGPASKGPSV